MSDQAGALWMPNSNAFPGRAGLRPRYVILHGTAGQVSAQNIATYFASTQGGDNPVSSHYVIGQDGTVVQCVSESDGAWANGALTAGHASFWDAALAGGNPNNLTISIEHCKPSLDNSDVLTPAQQAASFKLIYDICQRWGIPKKAADSSGGITGHFSLDPVSRGNCPGPYPWNDLWFYLAKNVTPPQEENMVIELDTPGVGQYFAPSADGYWRCIRTQKRVGGNILSFYKRFGDKGLCGLTYLGLPLTDMFVPKAGTYAQAFEHGVVVDDTNRIVDRPAGLPSDEHCYLAHLDFGFAQVLLAQPISVPLNDKIKSLEAQLAAAQKGGGDPAQIADLQKQITSLQGELAADKTKIEQAIALLQK